MTKFRKHIWNGTAGGDTLCSLACSALSGHDDIWPWPSEGLRRDASFGKGVPVFVFLFRSPCLGEAQDRNQGEACWVGTSNFRATPIPPLVSIHSTCILARFCDDF